MSVEASRRVHAARRQRGRRLKELLALCAAGALVVGATAGAASTDSGSRTSGGGAPARSANDGARVVARAAARVPTAKLLGQRIMVGFSGTSASSDLLRRVRAGTVGSVIIFAENI